MELNNSCLVDMTWTNLRWKPNPVVHFFKRGIITAIFKPFGKLPDWRELLTIYSTLISKQSKTFLNKLLGKALRQQVDGLSCVIVSSRVFQSVTLKYVIITTLLLSKEQDIFTSSLFQLCVYHKKRHKIYHTIFLEETNKTCAYF